MKPVSPHASQRGAALVSVIFLIVVVGMLGAFAVRTGMDQQQIATLALIEARADAAAFSALEYASSRTQSNPALALPDPIPFPADTPGMRGMTVRVTRTMVPGVNVYALEATARYGAFGNPDYVQRVRTRRVSTLGAGSW